MTNDKLSDVSSLRLYAKVAGVLILVSLLAGMFGEFYVPTNLLVPGDAAATLGNFQASESLFRLGFASYIVEALCDIALALVLYMLLLPVHKGVALASAFFGLVSTSVFAVSQIFFFTAANVAAGGAGYLQAFSALEISALMTLALKISAYAGGLSLVFYGTASFLRGYLVFRSGYLPRIIGTLLMLGGAGFVVKSFLEALAPAYASDFLLLPTIIAMLSFAFWLLVKGVDTAKLEGAMS